MRRFGLWLGRILFALGGGVAALWTFGPYEPVALTPSLAKDAVGEDVDAYFAEVEGKFDDIRPNTQKRVIWAGDPGTRREWAVLYVHGFSASSEEIRPVPDKIAEALEANLVFTRLGGHGRGSEAMAEPTVQDWVNDVAEALQAARRVGERVLVLSTSTGATLVAAAAHQDDMMENVAGVVLISPNFAVNNPLAPLLTWPAARLWLPLLAGTRRSFEPRSDVQAQYWTTEYPSVSVMPMAALVKSAVKLSYDAVKVPALFYYAPNDQVVRADATDGIVEQWQRSAGGATVARPTLGPDDDIYAHVVAGEILSPGNTEATAAAILDWTKGL